jgi:hypothetical protein
MPHIRQIFQTILPDKQLYYRLQDLFDSMSNSVNKNEVLISIEKLDGKREYCALPLSDLELLYAKCPRESRSFYECIKETTLIKTYIDFEYTIQNNESVNYQKAIDSCLKVLYLCLNASSRTVSINSLSMTTILKQFLVLNA